MADGLLDLLGGAFGTTPPAYLQGLLGENAVEDLRKRSIGSGLVNALVGYAAAPKNQNLGLGRILAGAAQAGMQGAQGVYQNATQDYMQAQKIAEMKRQQDQQARLQTMLAGITDPKERLAIEYSPNEYFANTFRPKEGNISKPNPEKFTPESLAKFATSSNYNDLKAIDSPDKGAFGSSLEGSSFNILSKGSLNTPEAVALRSTPDYAIAYYNSTEPKTVIEDRQDPNTGVVTRVPVTIKPAPLPSMILPPINLARPTATSMPSPVTSNAPPRAFSENRVPQVGDELPSNNAPSGNVKSNPMALTSADAGKVKSIQITQKNIVNAANRYETLLDEFDYDAAIRNPLDEGVRSKIATLNGAYKNLQMQAKNGYELGALVGPDIGILTSIISEPSSLKGLLYGRQGLKSQLSEFKTSMNQMRKTALDTYGIKVQPIVVRTGTMKDEKGKSQKVFEYDDGAIRDSKGSLVTGSVLKGGN